MKRMSRILKTKITLLAILILAAGLVFTNQTTPANSAGCTGIEVPTDGPAFNIWPLAYSKQDCRDYPVIDAKNVTKGGNYSTSAADHQNGVTAEPGDQVRVLLYFHNGASDRSDVVEVTKARNVRVSSGVPTAKGTTHAISGKIAGDNVAQTVYSSMPGKGGDIVINTSAPTTLEYVPGSTQRYTNSGASSALPDGVVNGAVGLGDVNACFQYSGFVTYLLKVVGDTTTPPATTTLSVEKTVNNPDFNSQTAYVEQVEARQNNRVNFQVTVRNTGSAVAENVVLTDILPAGLQFANGTNTANGHSLGNIPVGEFSTVNFSAVVTEPGTRLITNEAVAKGSNTNEARDTARVNVTRDTVVPPTPGLQIQKTVNNPGRNNQTAYVEQVEARQGDVVNFRIVVSNNTQGTANNVVLTDAIPAGLSYHSGDDVRNNISLGNMAPGASRTINFAANVTETGVRLITNTATADASNTNPVSDTARVNVTRVDQPGPANITVDKTVRNPGRGDNTYDHTTNAQRDDLVQYRITVTSNSSTTAQNVIVTDPLVAGLAFHSGDNPTGSGYNLGNIATGQSKTIEFFARVTTTEPSITLSNTATAKGSNTNTAQDTANVIVTTSGGGGGTTSIAVEKLVRNVTMNRSFTESETAFTGDVVEFQIKVRNTGSNTLNNVYARDVLPAGLLYQAGAGSVVDSLFNGRANLGTLTSGQERIITFRATVTALANTFLVNTAYAGADNVGEVSDTASLTVRGQVLGGNVELHKKAFNDTKGVDATTVAAAKEDFITYTLTVNNRGGGPVENFVIEDDLSGVLNYATMVEMNGGTIVRKDGKPYITWPAVTIPAGGSVTKVFRVRVNFFLPTTPNLQMVNVYGDTVVIKLPSPQVLGETFVAPKTGAGTNAAVAFATIFTLAFAFVQRKGYLKAMLSAMPKVRIQ
jgi:uncharacterized repeat protein (TIGR01451 family)